MKKKITGFILAGSLILLVLLGCPQTTAQIESYKDKDTDTSYRGYILSRGLYTNGTELLMSPYKMDLNGTYFEKNTVTVVSSDMPADIQSASTWYAVTARESDALLEIKLIDNFSSWTGKDLANNQLNMLDGCYNDQRGYCYVTDSNSIGYRVVGIFKSDASADNIDPLINIENVPKSFVQCYSDLGQQIDSKNNTIINYNKIVIDINSNITTGSNWKYLSQKSEIISINATIFLNQTSNWEKGDYSYISLYKNDRSKSFNLYEIDSTADGCYVNLSISNSLLFQKNDLLHITLEHTANTPLFLRNSLKMDNIITITEL